MKWIDLWAWPFSQIFLFQGIDRSRLRVNGILGLSFFADDTDMVEVPENLVVVERVTDHKVIRDCKTNKVRTIEKNKCPSAYKNNQLTCNCYSASFS